MRLLTDMGISPATVAFLRQLGHDAVHLHEERLDHLSDPDILVKARRERRIVLTSDLDFGEILAHSGMSFPSIIIFRLSDMRSTSVNAYLQSLLTQFADDLEAGAILSVTDRRVRAHRLPIMRDEV